MRCIGRVVTPVPFFPPCSLSITPTRDARWAQVKLLKLHDAHTSIRTEETSHGCFHNGNSATAMTPPTRCKLPVTSASTWCRCPSERTSSTASWIEARTWTCAEDDVDVVVVMADHAAASSCWVASAARSDASTAFEVRSAFASARTGTPRQDQRPTAVAKRSFK